MAKRKEHRPPASDRLLEVAIEQFGSNGPEAASTRAIAAAAGTTMSAITYHYGGKNGLYLAAARHIASSIKAGMAAVVEQSRALPDTATHAQSVDALLAILSRFAEIMIVEESTQWAQFMLREQMHPTKAFDHIYDEMIGPMFDHVSGIVLRLGNGRYGREEATLRTLTLIGQILVFRVARATVRRTMGWQAVGAAETSDICRIIQQHVRLILAEPQGDPPQ